MSPLTRPGKDSRTPPGSGISLVEMLIVVVLLVFALIPMMGLGSSTHRQAFFTEHQLMAMGRARLVLDLASAVDVEVYMALVKKAGGVEASVDIDQLCGAGTLEGLYKTTLAGADAYTIKLTNLTHRAKFVKIDDDLGRLEVEVRWTFAADAKPIEHSVKLERLLARREVGSRQRYNP